MVIGLIRGGGAELAHLVSLSPFSFSPCPLPNTLYLFPTIPPGGPSIHGLWWSQMVEDVEEVVVAVRGLSVAITSRSYGVFNSISHCSPHSTFHRSSKIVKIFLLTLYTYNNVRMF